MQVRPLYLVFTLVAEPGPLGTPGQGRGKGSRQQPLVRRLFLTLYASALQDPVVKGKLLGYRLLVAALVE